MGDGIWTQDLSRTSPRSVKRIIWGGILPGVLYVLAGGFGVYLVLGSRPDVPLAGLAIMGTAVGIGGLGVASGVLVWRRVSVGVPLAWAYAVGMGLWSTVALGFTFLQPQGPDVNKAAPLVAWLILSGALISALRDPETAAYLGGARDDGLRRPPL